VRDEYAEQATALLLAVAQDPASQVARAAYDSWLYPLLLSTVKRRGRWLATAGSRAVGAQLSVPSVPDGDLNDVAHMVTVEALERARASARRFDPRRGDGASWAVGALGVAYVDVVRREYRARRLLQEVPADNDDLADLANRQAASAQSDPAVQYEIVEAIDAALDRLTADERFVLLARLQAGMSYAEIAEYMRPPGDSKKVDRLLQSARAKVRAAEGEFYGKAGA
jgi:RNA polymerase sigma factor (sigma-70 family)